MRRRWEVFCESLITQTAENGSLDDGVLERAARIAYVGLSNPKTLVKRAKALLANPDVREAIASVYALRGFSIVDAIDKHLEHIHGPRYEAVVQGEVVRLRGAPSYQALKDFLAMTLPSKPKEVRVSQTSLHAHMAVAGGVRPEAGSELAALQAAVNAGPPTMEARVLSTKVESAPVTIDATAEELAGENGEGSEDADDGD